MAHEMYAESASIATGLDIEVLRCMPDTELLKMIPPANIKEGESLIVAGTNFRSDAMCFVGLDGQRLPHLRNRPEDHLRQGRGWRRRR